MNRFTSVRYQIPNSYDRTAVDQMIRWCKNHISHQGDKWDLDLKWVSFPDTNISKIVDVFIFENDEYKTQFVLANI